MIKAQKIHKNLKQAIDMVVNNKENYVRNPETDFIRNRKLPMKRVIENILSMEGGSLKKELFDFFKLNGVEITSSAFVQQRSKIHSDAFRDILIYFNDLCKEENTFRGYKLFAVDGSDVNCSRDPKSKYFFTSTQNPKGYNQIHLNAIYDICNKTYTDIFLQPRKKMDERGALISMLQRNRFIKKSIFIVDRGYESYNMFAHFINTNNVDFVCRVKDGQGTIYEIAKLPMEELDTDIVVEITTSQTNEDKLFGRRFIQTGSKKGKINSQKTVKSRWDFASPYMLNLRVVRIMLDSGKYETIVTSLDRNEFSIKDIKELYHMRWEIETSFRDLKYTIGLTNLHSKKDELVIQEIYAAIIMYNYCSRISGSTSVSKDNISCYAYKINFTMAVHICKNFYKSIKNDFNQLICDIIKHIEPIRPGRHDVRNLRAKRFVGFTYRVAA